MNSSKNEMENAKQNSNSVRGNYHVHTTFSDGAFNPEEVVDMAIDEGLSEIGITDHYFTLKGNIKHVDEKTIDEYVNRLRKLQTTVKDKIKILAGLEIDTSVFNPERSNLPFSKLNTLDYVLFEYVEDNRMGNAAKDAIVRMYVEKKFTESIEKSIASGTSETLAKRNAFELVNNDPEIKKQIHMLSNRRGVFTLSDIVRIRKSLTCGVGLAHPDIARNFSHYDPEVLARTLKENNIFLDACATKRNSNAGAYNVYGEGWPFTPFFCNLGKFKEPFSRLGVEFAPSTDTHNDRNVGDVSKAEIKIAQYHFQRKTF